MEIETKIKNLHNFVHRLENRRDNETLACTTNKVVLLLKDMVMTMQDMYTEIQTLKEQVNSQQPVIIQEEKAPQNDIIDEESGLPIDCLNQLKEWNNGKTAKVLCNSEVMTTKRFNEIVSGHQNVCIVIRTKDNHIFGTFSSKLKSPKSIRDDDFDVVDDDQYYVFSLRNTCGIKPTMFKKTKTMYTIARYASTNETVIFEAEQCFTLATQVGISSVIDSFPKQYKNVPEDYLKLFTDGEKTSFEMASIHIIEFN